MAFQKRQTKPVREDGFHYRVERMLKDIIIPCSKAQSKRNKELTSKRIEHSVNYWYKQDNADIFDRV